MKTLTIHKQSWPSVLGHGTCVKVISSDIQNRELESLQEIEAEEVRGTDTSGMVSLRNSHWDEVEDILER